VHTQSHLQLKKTLHPSCPVALLLLRWLHPFASCTSSVTPLSSILHDLFNTLSSKIIPSLLNQPNLSTLAPPCASDRYLFPNVATNKSASSHYALLAGLLRVPHRKRGKSTTMACSAQSVRRGRRTRARGLDEVCILIIWTFCNKRYANLDHSDEDDSTSRMAVTTQTDD